MSGLDDNKLLNLLFIFLISFIDGFQNISKKSKSGGINAGVLVGIILASVIVLVFVIGAIIYFKKRRKKKLNKEPSSSLENFKTFN